MNKKLFFKLLFICTLILASFIILVAFTKTKSNRIISIINNNQDNFIDLKKFEPFNKDSIIEKYETEFKIKDNYPRIDAASAFYILGSYLVEATCDESYYNDNLKLVSTKEAYEDLINEKVELVIATAPSDSQKELIEKSGTKLEFVKIADEKLVFYINKNNSVLSLNTDDIKHIYTENEKWNKYNSYDKDIVTYQLKKGNGSQTCFESLVKDNKIDENHKEIEYMEEIIDSVGNDECGIGYAFNSFFSHMYINEKAKKISINGIDTYSKEYPLKYDVYLIYNKNNVKNKNIAKIVKWLETDDGKDFVDFYYDKVK